MGWLVDSAPVVSAALAALAAGASWRSVAQGERLWKASIEPALSVQLVQDTTTPATTLTIYNIGGGVARNISFAIVGAELRATDALWPDGFLTNGEKTRITCAIPRADDLDCVVMYQTPDGSSYCITRMPGKPHRLRKGANGKVQTIDEVWKIAHPELAWPSEKVRAHVERASGVRQREPEAAPDNAGR